MKRLQNNFTTPEQSKRLLELGLPAESADCEYYEELVIDDTSTPDIIILGEKYENCTRGSWVSLPCWSVGRLMEIYVIASGFDTAYLPIERGEDMVKYLIRLYEEKARDFDFSKLEE